ncbi:hypothetical protein [Rhizobium oryzihabitans]|uniref:hypothetical protein n=1 Tax=Rhizobium oryzihabitans TaxID=2267833 RepID=UPI001FE6D7F3|nr:hypothetical protein [Rhizobium oryzihabitans]
MTVTVPSSNCYTGKKDDHAMQQDHGTETGQGMEHGMDAIVQDNLDKVQPATEGENLWDSPPVSSTVNSPGCSSTVAFSKKR